MDQFNIIWQWFSLKFTLHKFVRKDKEYSYHIVHEIRYRRHKHTCKWEREITFKWVWCRPLVGRRKFKRISLYWEDVPTIRAGILEKRMKRQNALVE